LQVVFVLTLRLRSLVAPALVLAFVSISALGLSRPAAAATCWQRVISDWRDGHIDGTYSPSCLKAALQNMPEDIRIYGSAEEDITRLLNATQARELAAASSPSRTAASSARATTTQATSSAPAAGSRSLSGRKPKAKPAPVTRVAAPAETHGSAGLGYETLLLLLAVAVAVGVVLLASARHYRRTHA
jgi:hypothetical protein